MHKPRHFALLLATFCSLAGLAPEAHAYLDPSTGSMILSAIVGLFATIGLAVKTYWYKLKNLVMRRPPSAPAQELAGKQPQGQAKSPATSQTAGSATGQANRPS